jgi:UDP-N-acetylglucosamine 4,6-dehydratase
LLNGKTILVTGGTGSFGKKFVDIVLKKYTPRKLIVFSRDELKQHEMRQRYPDTGDSPVRYFIGNVRDRERLYRAMGDVDIVIHAAALKQVPACEYNPFEAVQTNVLGTKNVIDAAIDQNVRKVMFISTDKAVNPVNLYGATKLCAEKMVVQANVYSPSETLFSVSRYGNVIGSRGSVIPLFIKQREEGKITVTDERMTRFWLTLEQGINFVLNNIKTMRGGEIFVPKIPSMRLMDLARVIAPEAEISYIGIRPSEKLHEVLLSEDEIRHTYDLGDKYVVQPMYYLWDVVDKGAGTPVPDGFQYSSANNEKWLKDEQLMQLVEEYIREQNLTQNGG